MMFKSISLTTLILHLFLLINLTSFARSLHSPLSDSPDGPKIFTYELSRGWTLGRNNPGPRLPVSVPGTFHTDLLQNGLIPDPFYRSNEAAVNYLEHESVDYECRFDIDPVAYSCSHIELIFEGLDTYADIFLHDSLLFRADNMFRTWKANVKDLVKLRGNLLRIRFYPVAGPAAAAAARLPYVLPGEEKVFVRKAQYQFGWDWGPHLVTCGIWRPVKLLAWDETIIRDVRFTVLNITPGEAKCEAITTVESAAGRNCELVISSDRIKQELLRVSTRLKPGSNRISATFSITQPELWWCNGLGKPNLYDISIALLEQDRPLATKMMRIGIRTIELVREKDTVPPHGSSFYFKLNGVPLFAKGANYIPPDNFMPRVGKSKYDSLIRLAAASNMNMLRVWGGGTYENDIFYDLCDEYGILVWQDFMFACAMYPGDADFVNNVRKECIDNIIRLRNHPCMALWCGNNEIDEGWKNWGWQRQFKYKAEDSAHIWGDYNLLFHEMIPELLVQLDPSTPYWPSSPSIGWGHPESLREGDSHYWGVWWGKEPFETYEKKVGRFMSEFGFQGFPDMRTIQSFTIPSDREPGSAVMKAHQKHPLGYETIQEYLEREYRQPKDIDQYAYVSQLLQAGGIGRAVTAHRLARPRCMGTLYWQLNDCWPVVSWSGTDWYGRWKALQYRIKELYAPVLLSIRAGDDSLTCFLDYQGKEKLHGRLTVEYLDFSGHGREILSMPLSVKYDDHPMKITASLPPGTIGREDHLFHAFFTQDEKIIASTSCFTDLPKNLRLTEPGIKTKVEKTRDGYIISLSCSYLAKNIWLRLIDADASFSNNYFDLIPGKDVQVNCQSALSISEFKEKLRISSLFNSY